jgi:hypothetical protein
VIGKAYKILFSNLHVVLVSNTLILGVNLTNIQGVQGGIYHISGESSLN